MPSLSLTLCGLAIALNNADQLNLRRDRNVVAHLVKTPEGSRVRQIGNALGLRDATVAKSLARLAADGLVVRETEGESLPMRSYRLAD
ncbi:MarR family transcriptional regulator [Kitasatospora sp. NBC_01287]|uniref:MarR family transcriptional regulator n=1 Tax=Kitasatospora sp. NBC_01287 TaxID=2903573 RepID=UPI00225708D4|nr:MarR family transcriptional regulator [Kitasatospora sp. NBC_01287]MCX4751236.1 MarR family transcriptional regulator [Kitasatospora sp. NBC_01287]